MLPERAMQKSSSYAVAKNVIMLSKTIFSPTSIHKRKSTIIFPIPSPNIYIKEGDKLESGINNNK